MWNWQKLGRLWERYLLHLSDCTFIIANYIIVTSYSPKANNSWVHDFAILSFVRARISIHVIYK